MGKWIHKVTEINEATLTGLCANCGIVPLKRKRNTTSKVTRYACKVAEGRWNTPNFLVNKPVKPAYLDFKKDSCARCGFVAIHKCQLDVHHIDHNHQNDAPENLETLCANCHRLHHANSEARET